MSDAQTIRREFGPDLASLLARAHGVVVDLGGVGRADLLTGAERLVALVPTDDAAPSAPGVETLVGTVDDLAASERSFDTIVAIGELADQADPERATAAVAARLSPGGRLLFAELEPRRRSLRRPPRREPRADIRSSLWRAGCSVIDSRWWTSRHAAALSGVARRRPVVTG